MDLILTSWNSRMRIIMKENSWKDIMVLKHVNEEENLVNDSNSTTDGSESNCDFYFSDDRLDESDKENLETNSRTDRNDKIFVEWKKSIK